MSPRCTHLSSHQPLRTRLGSVLSSINGSSFRTPAFALLLPRLSFRACQHGTALAQAVCVCLALQTVCSFISSLLFQTLPHVLLYSALKLSTAGLQGSLGNGFISTRCQTINAKYNYQTQLLGTCRIGRGASL